MKISQTIRRIRWIRRNLNRLLLIEEILKITIGFIKLAKEGSMIIKIFMSTEIKSKSAKLNSKSTLIKIYLTLDFLKICIKLLIE